MRFTVGGRPLDLAAEQVSRAMKQVEPEAIREHLVEMNGTVYPPKQVLAVVTGWARTTFTTMEAERVLMRLGFVCRRGGVRRSCRMGPGARRQWRAARPWGRSAGAESRLSYGANSDCRSRRTSGRARGPCIDGPHPA